MYTLKEFLRRSIPAPILGPMLAAYHYTIAHLAAIVYEFPSRKLLVIAVTGTKGKSSTTEMVNAILEEAGYKTALLNSIRFKIADSSEPNLLRMSMPGRFFIQKFLARAVKAGCTAVILEMTSEGARQYRHRAIDFNALIFMNLAPEHIESHGSLRAYADAKFEIGKQLARSGKRPRIIVANADDIESPRYLTLSVEERLPFSLLGTPHESNDRGGHFSFDDREIATKMPGDFSLQNALAAATLTHALGVDTEIIARALLKLDRIAGRAERIEMGQHFTAVVDYAHTPDSLKALYEAYAGMKKICVLGSTGGGRDIWKRPVMGQIADSYCDHVILTNEDPYDEDPRSIIDSLARGMGRAPEIIIDRREAIARALSLAGTGDAVLISGKGTDPTINGPHGSKIPWSDAQVVREELKKQSGAAL
jgi:UDP-N-acetylmuramoyl-L-alanyl-D-glutamate--2,6-diaminopimelate ligase